MHQYDWRSLQQNTIFPDELTKKCIESKVVNKKSEMIVILYHFL